MSLLQRGNSPDAPPSSVSDRRYKRREQVTVSVRGLKHPNFVLFNIAGDGTVQFLDNGSNLRPDAPFSMRVEVAPPFGADHAVIINAARPLRDWVGLLSRLDKQRNCRAVSEALERELAGPDDAFFGMQGIFTAESCLESLNRRAWVWRAPIRLAVASIPIHAAQRHGVFKHSVTRCWHSQESTMIRTVIAAAAATLLVAYAAPAKAQSLTVDQGDEEYMNEVEGPASPEQGQGRQDRLLIVNGNNGHVIYNDGRNDLFCVTRRYVAYYNYYGRPVFRRTMRCR